MISGLHENLVSVLKKIPNAAVLCSDELSGWLNFLKFFREKSFVFAGPQSMVLAACGFAVRGKMPLVFGSMADFSRAHVQIREAVGIPNLNVKFIVADSADESDFELMKIVTNMKIVKVSSAEDVLAGLNEYGPTCFILPGLSV